MYTTLDTQVINITLDKQIDVVRRGPVPGKRFQAAFNLS